MTSDGVVDSEFWWSFVDVNTMNVLSTQSCNVFPLTFSLVAVALYFCISPNNSEVIATIVVNIYCWYFFNNDGCNWIVQISMLFVGLCSMVRCYMFIDTFTIYMY